MGLILMILMPVLGTIQWLCICKDDIPSLQKEYTKPVYYFAFVFYILLWPVILVAEICKFLKKKLKEVFNDCTKHR